MKHKSSSNRYALTSHSNASTTFFCLQDWVKGPSGRQAGKYLDIMDTNLGSQRITRRLRLFGQDRRSIWLPYYRIYSHYNNIAKHYNFTWKTNDYVVVISMHFLKAFESVHHLSIAEEPTVLDIPYLLQLFVLKGQVTGCNGALNCPLTTTFYVFCGSQKIQYQAEVYCGPYFLCCSSDCFRVAVCLPMFFPNKTNINTHWPSSYIQLKSSTQTCRWHIC